MAKSSVGAGMLKRPFTIKKRTSIGQGIHSRPLNKGKRRSFKRYRGQGR